MSEEDKTTLGRRKVLKMAGVAAGAVSITGVGSASDLPDAPRDTMAEEFRNPNRVAEVLESEASGVLERLADKGYLDSASVDELPYSTTHPNRTTIDPADPREGAAATEFDRDGTTSTVVAVSKNVDGGTMTLYVRPDEGTAKARLSLDDGSEKLVDETRGEVSPSIICGTSTYCTDTVCKTVSGGACIVEYHKKVEEECCQYSDGSTDCTVLGTTCECAEYVGEFCG